MSEILIRLAYLIRERFRLKGQVKAASAHGRLTAMMLTVLPLFMMIALPVVAPGYLSGMATDPDGKWMIAGAVVAQILGYLHHAADRRYQGVNRYGDPTLTSFLRWS